MVGWYDKNDTEMTYLISYAYFRAVTDVSESVDDKTIEPKLKVAHDRLKFIIGRKFYDQLVSQYPNNFSSDNSAFYDPQVKEFLAWTAYSFYIPKANIYETRTGLRVFKEANSDAASDKQVAALISLANENAEFYKGALVNFLIEQQTLDSTKYPLYTEKWPSNKFTTSFNITAIRGRDPRFSRINTKTTINSDAPDSPTSTNFPQATNLIPPWP
jgi:hypothetical protein